MYTATTEGPITIINWRFWYTALSIKRNDVHLPGFLLHQIYLSQDRSTSLSLILKAVYQNRQTLPDYIYVIINLFIFLNY